MGRTRPAIVKETMKQMIARLNWVLNRADLAELWDGDRVIAADQCWLESVTPEGVQGDSWPGRQHDRVEDLEPPASSGRQLWHSLNEGSQGRFDGPPPRSHKAVVGVEAAGQEERFRQSRLQP